MNAGNRNDCAINRNMYTNAFLDNLAFPFQGYVVYANIHPILKTTVMVMLLKTTTFFTKAVMYTHILKVVKL